MKFETRSKRRFGRPETPGSATTRPEARWGRREECIRHSTVQGLSQLDNTVAHRDRRETMIKLSIFMVRRSDLTYEQFIQHWVKFMVPSSPPSRSRSNTFGVTFKITERAMLYQGQQPPTLTVSRRFGSTTSPGQKHSSNRMATGRT
jgi:hypothetical protein